MGLSVFLVRVTPLSHWLGMSMGIALKFIGLWGKMCILPKWESGYMPRDIILNSNTISCKFPRCFFNQKDSMLSIDE